MRSATVWFNKHLSNTWEILELLRAARTPGEFQVLCTHPHPRYAGRQHSDRFEQEPGGLHEGPYVEYCFDVARRHQVTHFFPGRKLNAIVHAQQRFEALGTRVVAAANAGTLDVLASKARVYRALADEGIRLPDYEVVNDLAGFDAAWQRLRPRHGLLCYKPAVSVYGIGFHIVADRPRALQRLQARHRLYITLEDARRKLAAKGRFRDLLLMEYLPGPERSVDCLARDGKLLRCVVRRKRKASQLIEHNPELVAVAARLTERFRLTNLFNVQFRNSGGRPCLLEINPRMSGGLPFACRSGLILPCWAIRLALGTAEPDDIPQPRTGIIVPQPEPVTSL